MSVDAKPETPPPLEMIPAWLSADEKKSVPNSGPLNHLYLVLKELYTTEKTFIACLKQLVEAFKSENIQGLTPNEQEIITAYLVPFKKIIESSEKSLADWQLPEALNDVETAKTAVVQSVDFMAAAPIEAYTQTMMRHQQFSDFLNKKVANTPTGKAIQANLQKATPSTDYTALSITVIQRLPRYEMLWKGISDELKRSASKEQGTEILLLQQQQRMTSVLSHIGKINHMMALAAPDDAKNVTPSNNTLRLSQYSANEVFRLIQGALTEHINGKIAESNRLVMVGEKNAFGQRKPQPPHPKSNLGKQIKALANIKQQVVAAADANRLLESLNKIIGEPKGTKQDKQSATTTLIVFWRYFAKAKSLGATKELVIAHSQLQKLQEKNRQLIRSPNSKKRAETSKQLSLSPQPKPFKREIKQQTPKPFKHEIKQQTPKPFKHEIKQQTSDEGTTSLSTSASTALPSATSFSSDKQASYQLILPGALGMQVKAPSRREQKAIHNTTHHTSSTANLNPPPQNFTTSILQPDLEKDGPPLYHQMISERYPGNRKLIEAPATPLPHKKKTNRALKWRYALTATVGIVGAAGVALGIWSLIAPLFALAAKWAIISIAIGGGFLLASLYKAAKIYYSGGGDSALFSAQPSDSSLLAANRLEPRPFCETARVISHQPPESTPLRSADTGARP